MDESEDNKKDDSNKQTSENATYKNDQMLLGSKNKLDEDEGTVSEGSISEHITSTGGSLENDRSFQEIEIFNQPSAFTTAPSLEEHISQEQKPNSFVLNSFNSIGLQDNMNDISKVNVSGEGPKNAKSILEEILGDTQFCSETDNTNSKEESFNLFANVDFSDKSLINLPSNQDISLNEKNLCASNFELPLELSEDHLSEKNTCDVDKKLKQLEEIVTVKDSTINALTQELDSFREMSNPTNTLSMVSATEYKQLQEECHIKLMEYNSAVIYKNDLIQKLSESLDQSVSERKELLSQVESFKQEIAQLQSKLQETSKMVQEHECNVSVKVSTEDVDLNVQVDNNVADSCSNNKESQSMTNEEMLKLQNEIIDLKEKMKHDKEEYESELNRLRDLLENIKCGSTELMELKTELEKKHTQEVEELRTYFEKKCVELEKNYSEEVFSQQSRKMSGSSSDIELSADLLMSNEPGPGGDHNKVIKSKEDFEKLKENLKILLEKMSKHSMEDLSDKDLFNLEIEVKNELNMLLKIGEKLEIKAIQNKYLEEINNLKYQLEEETKRHTNISISSAIQEVGNSGDFEINEVIESYERRLQEQVTLAKIDIINALEVQIQRLVSNEADDEEWPSELLLLRDRFTDKYEHEIKNLKEEHDTEIDRLKEEHLKILNGALDRARRRSLRDGESLSKGEMELLKERDILKRQVYSLRNLLSELVKYFSQAEDELNNTLVDNLLKPNNDTLNLEQLAEELNNESSGETTNSSKVFDSLTNVTRVHFAPNFGELINMIEHQSQETDESVDISIDLRNELGMCLEKLRQDANAILTLTTNTNRVSSQVSSPKGTPEEKLASLSKQLVLEAQHRERIKHELEDANVIITTMEKDKEILESRVDELLEKINILESDLSQARYKMAELIENGHKEVVSEGYGEGGNPPLHGLDDTMKALSNLQDKARTMLAQSRISADPNALHLIEELCRVGEKIKEDAKKEKSELQQQIEAADKKYKTTQKFLEEQAVEREQERDEAQKKIEDLNEQLKERDKDRANSHILSSECHVQFSCRELEVAAYQIVSLEQQLHEASNRLKQNHQKYKELEDERDEAVEKLKILRDIIHDLEHHLHAKDHEIEEHVRNVEKLECIVGQQHKSIDEFKLFDSLGNVLDIQSLRKHCEELEEEVRRLRIESELAGSEGALKQIKLQLFEFEVSLDRKTKDLELLHSTGTSCSSPSEDMSVRDMIKQQSPTATAMDECEVPLQQLARLKEKLIRHSRAEEAAIKRIQDLEMTVSSLKNEIEESQNEKEFMKRQIHEQLVLISDFQIRLDRQRIKAEHIEKQTNTSLESKIYDLQDEILNLQEKLRNKDKTIHHQDNVVKETQQRLKDLENEIATTKDDEILVEMQKELEALRLENHQMKDKLSTDNQILPNLVENIIQDKNADIEKLRDKLNQTEKLLYNYESLNLDKNDLKTLGNLKDSGCSIEQLISILDLSQFDQIRRCDNSKEQELSGLNQTYFKKSDDTEFLGSSSEPEISSIEKIGPSNLHYTVAAPLGKPNSTELVQKSTEKRVHFVDTRTEKLTKEIDTLQKEIETKNKIILEMETKINILNEFEDKITQLQRRLDETEQALTNATQAFEKEQEDAREREKKLGVELAEKKMHLSEKEKEIQALQEDSTRKDEMLLKVSKEKRDLEHSLLAFKKDSFENLDLFINEKNDTINRLREELTNSHLSIQKICEAMGLSNADEESKMDSLLTKLDSLKHEKFMLERQIMQSNEENGKLKKQLKNMELAIENLSSETDHWKKIIESKDAEIWKANKALGEKDATSKLLEENLAKKEALVVDKDCDIEILTEDMKFYQNQLTELEEKLKSTEDPAMKKQIQEGKLKLSELTKEVVHLQDLVREKERIIAQMTEDHKQVHSNIQAIDNRIKETGNIFDLSTRLKKEQKKNADLLEDIHGLKAKLLNYEVDNAAPMEEITGQLKKELECAAQLDSNILSAVSDQSLSSISESQDVEVYKKTLTRQKTLYKKMLQAKEQLEKDNLSLEHKCNSFQQKLTEMQNVLEKEQVLFKKTQIDDAKLMEQLRIKLEGALDQRDELQRVLEEERHCRSALEAQIEELKKTGSATSSESTKYKTSPTQDAIEVAHLRNELHAVIEEKNKLLAEMKSLKQENHELENNVKYTQEMLMLETERNRAHEEKFRVLNEKERSLTEELLRKRFELEVKEREVDEKKIKMDELQQEKNLLKKQKSDLLKALKAQATTTPSLDTAIPEALQNAIRELKQKTEENRRTLEHLEKEKIEKKHLEGLLRNEVRNNSYDNLPFADLVARCNYLFAKALKLESVKKALIWQKRYLVDYLQSHQRHCLIEVLPNQPHEIHCLRHRHSPLAHFRSAVYAVISIERMKYLVHRWQTGIRKYEKINARHYERSKQRFLQENPGAAANFQVGQPVSSQHFSHSPFRVNPSNPFTCDQLVTTDESRPVSPTFSVVSAIRETPWSGSTPPSKENRTRSTLRIGSSVISKEDLTTLRAPQLLNQLHARVEQIQETLNMPFPSNNA